MTPGNQPALRNDDFATKSPPPSLYREFLAEREEILKHKWIESEKAGHDIGFEKALVTWVVHHRADWHRARRQSPGSAGVSPAG